MRFLKIILMSVMLLAVSARLGRAADEHLTEAATAITNHVAAVHVEAHGGEAPHEEALPLNAVPIGHVGKLPITNSMLVTWIVAAVLIIFARIATRKIQDVPTGAQNFWEWLVES